MPIATRPCRILPFIIRFFLFIVMFCVVALETERPGRLDLGRMAGAMCDAYLETVFWLFRQIRVLVNGFPLLGWKLLVN